MTGFKFIFCRKLFVFFFSLFLISFFAKSAFRQNKSSSFANQQRVSTPIKTKISIDKLPLVREPAILTCTITSAKDAPSTKVQIELPPDTRVIDGNVNWEGDIFAGDVLELSLKIAFDTEGNKAIFCRALRVIDADNVWGDLSELYLAIGTDETFKHFTPAPSPRRELPGEPENPKDKKPSEINQEVPVQEMLKNMIPQPPGTMPSDSSLRAASNESTGYEAGLLTINGRWRFYDRDDTLTSEQMLVEIVRGDNNDHLAWCYTDIDGLYSCGPFSNPNSAGIKSWFLSYMNFSPYDDILVTINPDWGTTASTDNAYVTTTPVEIFSDGTHDIGAWEVPNNSTYERAYWITEDLIRVYKYIWFETGMSQNPQETAGPGTVEWKIDSTDGTYYLEAGNIHLTGADPLSNTVVGHEYAHNIMYSVYGYYPTTNCPDLHYIEDRSSIICAWTEGWANFLPLAVNNDPIYRWSSGAMLNLETPTWGTAGWDEGDDVEGRVAGALWDIYDSINDGYDKYCDGSIINIWDVFFHEKHDNFFQYWTSWMSRGHNISGANKSIYQNTIQYSIPPTITMPWIPLLLLDD